MNQKTEDLKQRLDKQAIDAHHNFVNEGHEGLKEQDKYWTMSKETRDELDNEESKLLNSFGIKTYRRPITLTMSNKTQTYGFHGKKAQKSSRKPVSKRGGNKSRKTRKSRRK